MMIKKEAIISGLRTSYLISPGFDPARARVFLPGWMSPADLFCQKAENLDNLVAINLPGWGGSDKPGADWGLVEYSGFLKEFLNKLHITGPVLIGHSVGAAIATEYLAQGGKAAKLIIIGGAIIREKSVRVRLIIAAAKMFRFLFPFINKRWRQKLAGKNISIDYVEAAEMEGAYRRLIDQDRQEEFKKLDLPICLIWGAGDPYTPLEQGRRLAGLNGRAELVIIPQAGHYVFLDQPENFFKELRRFL